MLGHDEKVDKSVEKKFKTFSIRFRLVSSVRWMHSINDFRLLAQPTLQVRFKKPKYCDTSLAFPVSYADEDWYLTQLCYHKVTFSVGNQELQSNYLLWLPVQNMWSRVGSRKRMKTNHLKI